MPLVVVLHGCTQNADAYDEGSGWSEVARKNGFALLFPEQIRANNPNLCFNWFQTGDTRRGQGEAASVHAMVGSMCDAHAIDPARIYVTGLSAGGAMASAMLATYPETFAAGAIIAGLPYGCASGVSEAFECMGGRGDPVDPAALGDKVRTAAPYAGRWPRVSVWQGSADQTVAPSNADAIVAQWTNVHGVPAQPVVTDKIDGYPRRAWLGADDLPVVEHYSITGMGHGTPLKAGTGKARAHMLDVGISSTDHIAGFFRIARAVKPGAVVREVRIAERVTPIRPVAAQPAMASAPPVTGPQKVIEDALRAAGLMR